MALAENGIVFVAQKSNEGKKKMSKKIIKRRRRSFGLTTNHPS